jgi:hypothetical protein
MHADILGTKNGVEIDHCDGNGLNNRRQNLRHATKTENQWNATVRQDNSSGFKGVCFDTEMRRWKASIQYHNKRIHLGRFDSAAEAAIAYDEAATRLFGEFAKTNHALGLYSEETPPKYYCRKPQL